MRFPRGFKPTATTELIDVPNTELIVTLTEHGMPRKDALALTFNPGLKLMATRFYFDIIEANKGNKEAKERVDYCRHMWNERVKVEKMLSLEIGHA